MSDTNASHKTASVYNKMRFLGEIMLHLHTKSTKITANPSWFRHNEMLVNFKRYTWIFEIHVCSHHPNHQEKPAEFWMQRHGIEWVERRWNQAAQRKHLIIRPTSTIICQLNHIEWLKRSWRLIQGRYVSQLPWALVELDTGFVQLVNKKTDSAKTLRLNF